MFTHNITTPHTLQRFVLEYRYGNVFTWYRPVTNKQLSSTCPPTKSGEVLHVPCALVIFSKFCFTKTTRERILCLPLRRIFGSNEDSKALRAIWNCAMNHSIHCMPSTTRAAARLLHCMSWNPKLSLKDLILKSDRSNNKKKVDDSNTLESLSESKDIIRLVESKYKFRIVDKSYLPFVRQLQRHLLIRGVVYTLGQEPGISLECVVFV